MKKLLLLLLVVSVHSSFAQDNSFELNEIQVIDSESLNRSAGEGLSFEEVSRESIDQIQPDSLDDVLSVTAGTTTIGGPRSSSEAPQVRGLDSKKIFIYIDNVKQTIRSDHSTMVAIDPEHLKAVEVYKSPASSIKGGSLGGGVVLVTKDAGDYLKPGESLGSEFKLGYQNSSQEKNGSAKIYGKNGKLQGLLSLSRKEAKDLKLSDGKTLPRSSYKDSSVSSRLTYNKNKEEQFKVAADLFNRKDNVPINPTLNPPEAMAELNGTSDINNYTYSFSYLNNSQTNKDLNLEFSLYSTEQQIFKTRDSDGEREQRETQTLGTSLLNRFDLDKNSNSFIVLGGELTLDSLDGKRDNEKLATYPNGKSSLASLFTHFNMSFGKLSVIPGLRYESYSLRADSTKVGERADKQLLKKIGFNYKFNDSFQISVNSSEGYNAPRVQDIYIDGLHHAGDDFFIKDNFFVPNEDLRPETSKVHEVEAKFQSNILNSEDLFTLSVQFYKTYVENYIYLEKIDRSILDSENGTTQFVNVSEVKLNGNEVSLDYLYDIFQFNVTYAEVRGRKIVENLWISDLPADQFIFNIKAEISPGLTVGYLGILAEEQNRVNPGTTERTDATEGYFIHNAFINKQIRSGLFKNLELSTRIENIADKEYRKHGSHIKEKGFDFKVGLKYRVTYL